MSEIRVGVLDTGIAVTAGLAVAARKSFVLASEAPVAGGQGARPGSRHGTDVARIIAGLCAEAMLLDARVFAGTAPSSAAVVAAGLDWLVDAGAAIVNMSFGLRADRDVLRSACRNASDRDVMLVAATPAAGDAVFPASYPGVIRVTGDARCGVGVYTEFASGRVDFGACNGGLDHRPHSVGGGASLAVPHVVGYLATQLGGGCNCAEAVLALRNACRFRGREVRGVADAG